MRTRERPPPTGRGAGKGLQSHRGSVHPGRGHCGRSRCIRCQAAVLSDVPNRNRSSSSQMRPILAAAWAGIEGRLLTWSSSGQDGAAAEITVRRLRSNADFLGASRKWALVLGSDTSRYKNYKDPTAGAGLAYLKNDAVPRTAPTCLPACLDQASRGL